MHALLCVKLRHIISEYLMMLRTQTADASGERRTTAYNLKEDTCYCLFYECYLWLL